MRGGICAAVTEDVALGLSLAGVTDLYIHTRISGGEALKDWYREKLEKGVGVMVLSRECGEILSRELFERRVTGDMLPVTVIIPGEEEDRRAAELIKRAIGMDPTKNEKGIMK
jgi:vacuolar-type H+-ATPase subunit F/Vma7